MAASKKAAAKSKGKRVAGAVRPLAIVYEPLGKKLNDLFNNNRAEYFAKFKAAVGNDPSKYVFGQVVRQLPDAPGSQNRLEPDPNNSANPGKWTTDVAGIAERDRKLLQMVIAGNIFSREPMLFDFTVRQDEANPRVDVRTTTRDGAHVLVIDIYCGKQ